MTPRGLCTSFGLVIALAVVVIALHLKAAPKPDPVAMAALGDALFHSPRLSKDGTLACSGCHIPAYGYSGKDPLALGVGGYIASRRAPALLDLQDAHAFMWDGRAARLEDQIPMPLESHEMAVDWNRALRSLNGDPQIHDKITAAKIAALDRAKVIDALSAYIRTLKSGQSRFDRFYEQHDPLALTDQEQQGFRLFVHKAGCASCHFVSGPHPAFTDGEFHSIGIGGPGDLGRGKITGVEADRNQFKTPNLRNVAQRPYMMHDGSMRSLPEIVHYYNRGPAMLKPQADPRLQPLLLTPAEENAIVSFLNGLSSTRD